MKYHEIVVRFPAATAVVPRVRMNIQKNLRNVRAVTLKQYLVDTNVGSDVLRMTFPDAQIRPQQASSDNMGGFIFPARDNQYDPEYLVAECDIKNLEVFTVELSDSVGGAVTFTEACFWFRVYYEDEHTDLAEVAIRSGITEVVAGNANTRQAYVPTFSQAAEMYDALAANTMRNFTK